MTTFEDIYSMVVEDEKKLGQYASNTIPIHVFIAKSYEQGKKDRIKEERELLRTFWNKSTMLSYSNFLQELMKD